MTSSKITYRLRTDIFLKNDWSLRECTRIIREDNPKLRKNSRCAMMVIPMIPTSHRKAATRRELQAHHQEPPQVARTKRSYAPLPGLNGAKVRKLREDVESELLQEAVQPKKFSSEEALALMVDFTSSVRQYQHSRIRAKEIGSDIYTLVIATCSLPNSNAILPTSESLRAPHV